MFLPVATPVVLDFWAVPDDRQQDLVTHFLKNVDLFGASPAFLVDSGQERRYSVVVAPF